MTSASFVIIILIIIIVITTSPARTSTGRCQQRTRMVVSPFVGERVRWP